MRVNYVGKFKDKSNHFHRLAEINFKDAEESVVDRIISLMKIKGYKIDIITNGYAMCEVEDKDEYNEFMQEWKISRHCIKNCIKFGF